MVAIVIFFSSHPWLFNDSHGRRGLFVVPEVSTKIIFLFEINYEECIAWNPNPWNSKKCFFCFLASHGFGMTLEIGQFFL